MTKDDPFNRLLAPLEPEDFAHLETVTLPAKTVLYEAGDTLRHAYFPHDAIVALVAVMRDGGSAEIAASHRSTLCFWRSMGPSVQFRRELCC
jgi:hypothetical protein